MANDSTFGARLALVRQRMGWGNVKEAADACGVPVESWRRWERDGRSPRDVVEVAAVISDATGCDYGWLLAGSRLAVADGTKATVVKPTKRATGRYPEPNTWPADMAVRASTAGIYQPKKQPNRSVAAQPVAPKVRRAARIIRPAVG